MKRLQLREAFHVEGFDLSQRLDGHQLAMAQHLGRLAIFVDQAFDREDELIIEWRTRALRQTADIDL